MTTTISPERVVTTDQLVEEANKMWKFIKCIAYSESDVPNLMVEVRKRHPQFCQSYPIVVRYMVYQREYDENAMRKYIMGVEKRPWKSEKDFHASQADYVAKLYMETHKNWNPNHVRNIRKNVCKLLTAEADLFKKQVAQCTEIVEQKEKRLNDSMRRDFIEFMKTAADTIDAAGTTRIKTDLTYTPTCRTGEIEVEPMLDASDLLA